MVSSVHNKCIRRNLVIHTQDLAFPPRGISQAHKFATSKVQNYRLTAKAPGQCPPDPVLFTFCHHYLQIETTKGHLLYHSPLTLFYRK